MMTRNNGLLLYVLLASVPRLIAAPPEQKIEIDGGVRIVHNKMGGMWGNDPKIAIELVRKIGDVDTDDENLAFSSPADMAVDGSGSLYILDSGNQRIQVFGPDGKYIRTIGRKGQGPGEFESLNSIAVDGEDHACLCFLYQNRVEKYSPEGPLLWRADRELNYSTKLLEKGRQEVTGNSTRFYAPKLNRVTDALAADGKGRVWVVTRDRQIRKEEEVTMMVSGSVDRGSTRKVVGNTDLRKTDMYKLEVFGPDGVLLGAIPLTHFVDGIWIHHDRLFLLDRDRGVQFYEYGIREK
jgi:hypothetical protein